MTKRVLLIDSDPTLGSEIEGAFAERGFAIDHAPDTDSGRILIEEFDYAVVLLDIMLARQSGLELLRTEQARLASTPVVIISAYLPDYLRGALAAFPSVKLIVPKPVDPKALATVVAALLSSP
ncbi:MAG: response regulator transcription factor [Thermoanaerobaculia bacterium]